MDTYTRTVSVLARGQPSDNGEDGRFAQIWTFFRV